MDMRRQCTVQGLVGEKPVEVLRETGCSGVIVSKYKDLVPESAYTGKSQAMVMVDYSSRVVPEVKVSIDTPYYKGEVLALCVEKLLVGLIIATLPCGALMLMRAFSLKFCS